jgi:transposase
MRVVREVLRLTAAGFSQRQIAANLNLSHGVVGKYQAAARNAGVTWSGLEQLDDSELSRFLFPTSSLKEHSQHAPRYQEPDFAYIHSQLKRKGVTRFLLWEEYKAVHKEDGYSYTQFCIRYRQWTRCLKLTMRQTHIAGEKMFVDYCGPTVSIIDIATGEVCEAQIFVAVLGASNYTFAEATLTQGLADWIGSHTRAFNFFGGVPSLVVPDNLKSGVTKSCRYEPVLNESYKRMLLHYNTTALPARPYKPKDKAKVEAGVQVVERWILARLRHQQFFNLFELNLEIRKLLEGLNYRPFKKLVGCRRSVFEELERPALRPLPAQAYEYAEWRKARVHLDYHIEIEKRFYSVPHSFVKREIDIRLTEKMVECFCDGRRIAVHVRSSLQGSHSTQAEHMPKAHRAHMEWTPGRFLTWAHSIGPHTRDLVRHLLNNKPHPEMGYRSCLGLLSLAKQYGPERLEKATKRAFFLNSPTRSTVLSILKNGLENQPLQTEEERKEHVIKEHENVRGAEYYQ